MGENDKGLVGFNTVNMANAITPESPHEQMNCLTTSSKPVGLWVGADDELFDAQKVTEFVTSPNNNKPTTTTPAITTGTKILPGKSHLGILVDIHKEMGPWIVASSKSTR